MLTPSKGRDWQVSPSEAYVFNQTTVLSGGHWNHSRVMSPVPDDCWRYMLDWVASLKRRRNLTFIVSPDVALRLITDERCRLDTALANARQKVREAEGKWIELPLSLGRHAVTLKIVSYVNESTEAIRLFRGDEELHRL